MVHAPGDRENVALTMPLWHSGEALRCAGVWRGRTAPLYRAAGIYVGDLSPSGALTARTEPPAVDQPTHEVKPRPDQ
jgi:hypothetical protein